MSAALRIQLMLLARKDHFGKKSDAADLTNLQYHGAQHSANPVHVLNKDFESIRLQDHTKSVAIVQAKQAENVDANDAPAKVDLNKLVSHPKPIPAMRAMARKAFK